MAKLKKISKLFGLSVKCIEKLKRDSDIVNMSMAEYVEDCIMRRKVYNKVKKLESVG